MSSISIRTTSLDHASVKEDLRAILAASPAWVGNLDNQTGSTLMDFVAAITVFDQQKILRALQEAFPETSVTDRSALALADLQGVRLKRKSPSFGSVTLTCPTTISIPRFTQFLSSGIYLFNRDVIVLPAGVPTTVTLYEGVIKSSDTVGLGVEYQKFASVEYGFVVSDTDVQVSVNGNPLNRTDSGLWNLRGVPGFQDKTLPDGRLSVVFGNEVYGYQPKSDDKVTITYAVTSGVAGNQAGLTGLSVSTDFNRTVTGSFTSTLAGGSDQIAPSLYKQLASQTFGTFGSAVTKRQYLAAAREFPGIIDVLMIPQREIDPTDLRWMNVIKVVPLSVSPWTAAQQSLMDDHLRERTMFSTRFVYVLPTPSPTDVSIKVFCYNWANASEVRLAVEAAITKMFLPRPGIIGYDIYKSEIMDVAKEAHPGVDYVDLVTPVNNLIVSANRVEDVVGAGLNAVGGTLTGGTTYYYSLGVTVSTAAGPGYTKPLQPIYVPVAAGDNAVQLNWSPVPNALTYHVYGRTNAGLFSLVDLPASNASWLDLGTTIPGSPVPTADSMPVQYLTLGNLNVSSEYSTRASI